VTLTFGGSQQGQIRYMQRLGLSNHMHSCHLAAFIVPIILIALALGIALWFSYDTACSSATSVTSCKNYQLVINRSRPDRHSQ
jgi:hypothetical protein